MKKQVLYIFLLTFIIRILWLLFAFYYTDKDYSIFYKPDSGSYINSARGLYDTFIFQSNDEIEIRRTPGYPVFLAIGFLTNYFELFIIIIQIIIASFISFLIYKIAHLLFNNESVSFIAASFYAFEPISILYSTKLLTETLFSLFLILFLYYIIKHFKIQRIKYLYYSIFYIILTVYIRPISYYLTLYVLLIFVVYKFFYKIQLKHIIICFCISICLLNIWKFRNKYHTGYYTFSTIQNVNLYLYIAASIIGYKEQIPFTKIRDDFQNELNEMNLSKIQEYEYMNKKAKEIIYNNIYLFTKIHFEGIFRIIYDPGATEFIRMIQHYPEDAGLLSYVTNHGIIKTIFYVMKNRPLLFWTNFIFMFLWLFYLFCFIIVFFHKKIILKKEVIFSLLIIWYFLFLSGGPQAYSRFRHPIMPIMCIFCGFGLNSIINYFKNKKAV